MKYWFEGVEDLVEYPDGVVPVRAKAIKPFPTCQTCEHVCHNHPQFGDDICQIFGDKINDITEHFCAYHPGFAGVE